MGNNHVHLANASLHTVKVLVSPNVDYVIADLFIGAAEIVLDGIGVISSVSDLMKIFKAISFQKDAVSFALTVKELFDKYGIEVKPDEVKEISSHALYNPLNYFTASGWAALLGGSDLTLTVMLEGNDWMKMLQFNTNSDWSWIVHEDEVNRAVYGTLWEDGGERKPFVTKKL